MIRRPTRSTRTDTLFPYTTLFRSKAQRRKEGAAVDIEELASVAVDCGFHLHKNLGPGLLESVYEAILFDQLVRRGLDVQRQAPIPIRYDGVELPERSEERRVGKECVSTCRSRWSAETSKKKKKN